MLPQQTTPTVEKTTSGIGFDTELGSGLLIAESDDGAYQPVSVVSTINEAIEMAEADFARRREELDRGADPMCPTRFVVWARGTDGVYKSIYEFEPK